MTQNTNKTMATVQVSTFITARGKIVGTNAQGQTIVSANGQDLAGTRIDNVLFS